MLCFSSFAASNSIGKKVLDIGAGDCYLGKIFEKSNYESQDNCSANGYNYTKLDHKCEIYSMTVDNESYDSAICLSVLEHVIDPEKALIEIKRVLKPGGVLYFFTPFMTGEHLVPNDYLRYTRYWFLKKIPELGFEIVSIEPSEGWLMTIYQMLHVQMQSNSITLFIRTIMFPLFLVVTPVIFLLDKLDRSRAVNLGYEVVVKKV